MTLLRIDRIAHTQNTSKLSGFAGSAAGAAGSATAGVMLADDVITAAKFDETTAFPLSAADSGATAVARTGADADTLETLSDQIDGLSTSAAPQLLQNTTIASLSSQTSFTLTAGSADDDAYNGAVIVVTDQSTAEQKAVGTISDYVGSTRTITLSADPGVFTMAVGDTVDILATADVQAAATAALNAYDPPTNTELNARTLVAADYATALELANVAGDLDDVVDHTGTTIPALITALNDFDPATDTVANVTTVGTITDAPTNWSAMAISAGGVVEADVQLWLTSAPNALNSGNVPAHTASMAAGVITSTVLNDGAITANKFAASAITSTVLAAGCITSSQIASGAITSTGIAANAIGATQIASSAITSAKIASSAIGSTQLAANAIGASQIATGAITAAKFAANAITDTVIANGALPAGKFASGSFQAGIFGAGAITAAAIADGALTSAKFAAGAITANAIASDAIAAAKIATGAITDAKFAAGAITSIVIANAAITAAKFDETTAFPLTAADSGATAVARTGADADTLETLSDQIDGLGAGGATPQLLQNTTIASLASQTSFTLTAGSADNDAYNGAIIVVTDQSTAEQKAVGLISDYVGSTRTVTLAADPGIFTMAVGDTVDVLVATDNAPTVTQIRAELATELARIDVATSTRLASASYTAPDNATITTISNALTAGVTVADILNAALAKFITEDTGEITAVDGSVAKIAQGAAGGNVTVGSMTQAALAQFVTDDTGETAAVANSVAALSQGAGGGGGGDLTQIQNDIATITATLTRLANVLNRVPPSQLRAFTWCASRSRLCGLVV